MNTASNPTVQQLLPLCDHHLSGIVQVESYEYISCYLWHDRPLYNEYGEKIRDLRGDTIYLDQQTPAPASDLFHELGHLVARKHNLVGNTDNGFRGTWEDANTRLIARVSNGTHWSAYLNLFALKHADFKQTAASELWAELFMLWYLQPEYPEARLLDSVMPGLQESAEIEAIIKLAGALPASDQAHS